MGALWLFFSVFVTSLWEVGHNDDGICKIPAPIFCLRVDSPKSGIFNYVHQMISSQQIGSDVEFIGRSKGYHSAEGKGPFLSFIIGYGFYSLLKTLLWLWNAEQQ